jgi:hypothetical protein
MLKIAKTLRMQNALSVAVRSQAFPREGASLPPEGRGTCGS